MKATMNALFIGGLCSTFVSAFQAIHLHSQGWAILTCLISYATCISELLRHNTITPISKKERKP
jgi:hypothetical protein